MKAQGGVRQAVFFVIEHFLFFKQVVKKGSFGELLLVFEIHSGMISSMAFGIWRPGVDTDCGPLAGSCGRRCRRWVGDVIGDVKNKVCVIVD